MNLTGFLPTFWYTLETEILAQLYRRFHKQMQQESNMTHFLENGDWALTKLSENPWTCLIPERRWYWADAATTISTFRERVRPLATFLECRLGSDVNGHWLHKHVRNSSGHKSHQNAKHSFNHITESADTGTGSRRSSNKIEKFQTFDVLLEQSRTVSQVSHGVTALAWCQRGSGVVLSSWCRCW